MDVTKAKINLKEGIIELEGNELFVSKYLDSFKDDVISAISNSMKESEIDMQQGSSRSVRKTKVISKELKRTFSKSPSKVDVELFEINEDTKIGTPSLESFFDLKGVDGSASSVILGVGYYICHHLNQPEFSEGNVEFACKALDLDRPLHLHQAFLDAKSKKSWIEDGSAANKWKVSRLGEIEIEKWKKPIEKGE